MKKAIFIYNPLAGSRHILRKLDYIIQRFQEKNTIVQPYRLSNTNDDGLISLLKEQNFDFAVISGGDGTLNCMTNLFLNNGIDLPIGVIPSGTCNDFARCLNIPNALSKSLDIILSGKIVEVDVGLINEKQYFLNTCAGGHFVDVSFNTHNELKKNIGPFAYYLKALSEVANIRSFKLKITTETETIDEEALLFIILNGKHGGGFSNLIEKADITDGIMDIVVIKKCLHIDLASLFFKALRNDYLNDKNVISLRTKSCIIKGTSNIALSVDGEKGDKLPVTVRFINKALKVFAKSRYF